MKFSSCRSWANPPNRIKVPFLNRSFAELARVFLRSILGRASLGHPGSVYFPQSHSIGVFWIDFGGVGVQFSICGRFSTTGCELSLLNKWSITRFAVSYFFNCFSSGIESSLGNGRTWNFFDFSCQTNLNKNQLRRSYSVRFQCFFGPLRPFGALRARSTLSLFGETSCESTQKRLSALSSRWIVVSEN